MTPCETPAVPRRLTAELVLDARAELAEGPRWDERTGRLLWVDILGGEWHAFDPATGADVATDARRHIGAIAPRAAGGYVAAVREGFALIAGDGAVSPLATPLADRPDLRMNDGRCDRAGRFWGGSMSYDLAPGRGELFRLEADGTASTVLAGVGLANGIDWTPGDGLMYFVDTLPRVVDVFAFDPESGTPSAPRRFLDVDAGEGSPDGLVVDAEGGVWIAFYGGGCVRRYAPGGRLDVVVDVPGARHVTSPAFGGAGLDVLYVTTALENLDAAERAAQPHAGGIFAVEPGVRGQPTSAYAG